MAQDLAVRIIINGEDRTGDAFNRVRQSTAGLEQGLQRIENRVGAILGLQIGAALAGHAQALIATTDAYKNFEGRLRLVADNLDEFTKAEQGVIAISERTRSELVLTADLYGKLETVIKRLGGAQDQALHTTETINKAIAIGGSSSESAAAGLQQFIQGLNNGALRGEEFNSVMEQTPGLAKALADGLEIDTGQLRLLANNGQLTSDTLINALGRIAPAVDEQFKKIPVTVSATLVQLKNAFTVYIGEQDKASGASETLIELLQSLAKNIDTVANAGITLVEVFLLRWVAGLARSTQSLIENTLAQRAQAAAQAEARTVAEATLRTEIELARARVASAEAAVLQAEDTLAAAAAGRQQLIALRQLEAAQRRLTVEQERAMARQRALDAVLTASNPTLTATERAFNGINHAINFFIAFEVGKAIGEWALKFENFRILGTYIAEAFTLVKANLESIFNGSTQDQALALFRSIHDDYQSIRQSTTDEAIAAAEQQAQAEQTKTQKIQEAHELQAHSFKSVQDASKVLTAQINQDAEAQTAAIEQHTQLRLAALEAGNLSEAEKANERVQIQIQSGQEILNLQQQITTDKLALIDREYQGELELSAQNADQVKRLEGEKLDAKQKVYAGLADFYQQEVDKLAGVYVNEMQLADQANRNIQQLEIDHQHALLEIERKGFTDQQKLDSEQAEYNKTVRAAEAEAAKGKAADREKINALLGQAKALSQDLDATEEKAAKNQNQLDIARYNQRDRENQLYGIEKKSLEAVAKAHEDNANAAKSALESTQERLSNVNQTLADIGAKLKQQAALKIEVDQQSVAQVKAILADLAKPETKVITVKTVNESAQSGGGPAGFAAGGYTRRNGRLPGFGGGDSIRSLLEPGEFIMRKEAVAKFGQDFMYSLNAGIVPPIMRALGGLADATPADLIRHLQLLKRKKDELLRQYQQQFTFGGGLYGMRKGHEQEAFETGNKLNTVENTIGELLEALNKTGNSASLLTVGNLFLDPRGKEDFTFNGKKTSINNLDPSRLTDKFADFQKTLSLPSLPSAVQQASSSQAFGGTIQPNVIAPEVIQLDLSMNGKTASGNFPKTEQTRSLLDEIRKAGTVST